MTLRTGVVTRIVHAVAATLAFAACSPSMRPDTREPAAVAVDEAAVELSGAGAAYAAGMAAADSVSACATMAQQYAERAKPLVDRLTDVAGQMDATLAAMGREGHGDVGCSVGALAQELARHLAVACAVPDMPANTTEPTTFTWPSPPRIQPTSASAKL